MSRNRFKIERTERLDTIMCHDRRQCSRGKIKIENFNRKFASLNVYCIIIITSLSLRAVNSNTTNMNRHANSEANSFNIDHQNDAPNGENYEDHDTEHEDVDFAKVNFENNPYYNSEDFLHKIYNNENNAYSNYEDYKRYYLNPTNPISKSNVKFKISSRIVQTKYGKLQGIVLAMDEHRYLSPLEVFLGVPYATPPVGSNR